jgi:hypothetical protein
MNCKVPRPDPAKRPLQTVVNDLQPFKQDRAKNILYIQWILSTRAIDHLAQFFFLARPDTMSSMRSSMHAASTAVLMD